ncbi:histidine phosphatase family protein [Aciduricibacillus chroicocephali]|uniref:Histidine phosphatase family protein n=1 Tax=Aciduricibacillus chroicocephali TaxID=3054939 RepID=A0ABY9KXH4_9BACI|nr:histidine phosphatase family protein [Bacillaceae bacterium 44XB]
MEKNIYIIRHCKAKGQYPEAELTEAGQEQAKELAAFLKDIKIERIISSPYLRAKQTIAPFAEAESIEVEIDSRLAERTLDPNAVPDWLQWMKDSFKDLEIRDVGGESGKEATERIAGVIHDIVAGDVENTAVVTHGGMTTLLLRQYDEGIGFDQWKALSNPDVYVLTVSDEEVRYERLWKS